MAKKKKSKREKIWSRILIIAILEVLLVVVVMIVGVFFVMNPPQEETQESTQYVENDETESDSEITTDFQTAAVRLEVTYSGRTVYAGGQMSPKDFEVILYYEDDTFEVITEYDSVIQLDTFRLEKGMNYITFFYDDLWATINIRATDASELYYAPSYVIDPIDERVVWDVIGQIDRGEQSYRDVLANVAFTGDSQIKALTSYGILSENQVVAKVGESLNYMEANLDQIIAVSRDKEALVVHYGINSLSTSKDGRIAAIERYQDLLLRLKDALPDTRIIVSGLFPVADTIYYDQKRFAYIDEYNTALFEMCCEIGVEYLSDNEYISMHQHYFAGDGLHLTKAFYTEYWLRNLIITMGINGGY